MIIVLQKISSWVCLYIHTHLCVCMYCTRAGCIMTVVVKCCVAIYPLFFLYWGAFVGEIIAWCLFFLLNMDIHKYPYVPLHMYLYIYSCILEVFSNLNGQLIQAVCKWTADPIFKLSSSNSCVEWTLFHSFPIYWIRVYVSSS